MGCVLDVVRGLVLRCGIIKYQKHWVGINQYQVSFQRNALVRGEGLDATTE